MMFAQIMEISAVALAAASAVPVVVVKALGTYISSLRDKPETAVKLTVGDHVVELPAGEQFDKETLDLLKRMLDAAEQCEVGGEAWWSGRHSRTIGRMAAANGTVAWCV